MTPLRLAAVGLATAICAAVGLTVFGRAGESVPADRGTGKATGDVVLTADAVDPNAVRKAATDERASGGKVVSLLGAGEAKSYRPGGSSVSPGAPTDAEVKADLRDARAQLSRFKRFLGSDAYAQSGPRAKVLADGTAVAPENAPESVKQVIQAGNAIAKLPYKWGGGHGAWRDNGYDCSGSVSFALAGAGLPQSPMASGGFMNWGEDGPGQWITIHAGPGHMYMVVAGLRFDTSGAQGAGTRWQANSRGMGGLQVRHIPGL